MLKEQLLKESQELTVNVEGLNSILESVELSDEVKANLKVVFEQAVKSQTVVIAEKHINELAEKADVYTQTQIETGIEEAKTKLCEDIDAYLGVVAEQWLKENEVAVNRDIKADLTESIMIGLKELFVEHNVVVPEESVDVVEEMTAQLGESREEITKLFEQVRAKDNELNEMKRDVSINSKSREKGLTESQIEQVRNLMEGVPFSDEFETKLTAIVEMTSKTSETAKNENETNLPEQNVNENKGTEFVPENTINTNNTMSQYTKAAQALS